MVGARNGHGAFQHGYIIDGERMKMLVVGIIRKRKAQLHLPLFLRQLAIISLLMRAYFTCNTYVDFYRV